jgi:hypothetical protein
MVVSGGFWWFLMVSHDFLVFLVVFGGLWWLIGVFGGV